MSARATFKKILLTLGLVFTAQAAQAGDPHIGRVLVSGRDVCTGALVSPSIVMTAAHCLQDPGSKSPLGTSEINFLIKSPEDGKRRLFGAQDIGTRPDFAYTSQINPGIPALQADVAFLRLDGIATRTSFEKIGNPANAQGLSYIPAGLSSDRSPFGVETCLSKLMPNGLLILSCHRDRGSSGTPVFSTIDSERRVIGVVAAKSERAGVPVLYAVVPHLTIANIVWRKGNPAHQMRLIADTFQP